MVHSVNTTPAPREVRIPVGGAFLYGDLVLPPGFHGLVLFAHGSGSGRHSARNRQVAQHLQHAGIATLLFDLLTAQEEQTDLHTREHRFDIPLLTRRMQDVTVWAASQPGLQYAAIGYFGASTGSAAALIAAARLGHQISPLRQVGFYGLDLYSLFSSNQAVLTSTGWTRKRRAEHGTATPASTMQQKTARPMAMPPALASRGVARTRWCNSCAK